MKIFSLLLLPGPVRFVVGPNKEAIMTAVASMKTNWIDRQGDEVTEDSKVVDCCRCRETILAEKSFRIDGRPCCYPCYLFMNPPTSHYSFHFRPGDLSGDEEDARLRDETLNDIVIRLMEDLS